VRKKILQKAIISYLIIILSISVFPIIEADNEQFFTEHDCECAGLEMVLEESTADPYGGQRLTCSYTKGETGTMKLEVIYYQNGGASDGFQTRLDMVEWILESPEKIQIFDSEISDNRCFYTQRKPTTQIDFDFVERHQTVLYNENYVIKIDGSDSIDLDGESYVSFGDYEEFVNAFDDLENCIKGVIDAKVGDQDVAKVLKGRITTTDVPRNLREVILSRNIDGFKEKFVNMATGNIVPLKQMKVVLDEGDSTTETTTDSDGNYEITINDFQENKEYGLKIIFEYVIDYTAFFSIYYQTALEPVSYTHTFKIKSDSDLTQDIKLDDIFTKEDSTFSFILLYLHTA